MNNKNLFEQDISPEMREFLEDTKEHHLDFENLEFSHWNIQASCDDYLLHAAVRFEAPLKVVQELIEHGIDVNAQGDMSQTPLNIAVSKKFLETAKLLMNLGADPTIESEFGTALQGAKRTDQTEMLELLEKYQRPE